MRGIFAFFLSLSFIFTQISIEDAKILLKITEKTRKFYESSLGCYSLKKIKRLVKTLNAKYSSKRNKAYNTLKKIIYCEEVKKYLENNFNKFSPMVKYLIINAAFEKEADLNIPLITNIPKKPGYDIRDREYYYSYSFRGKAEIFKNINTCNYSDSRQNNKLNQKVLELYSYNLFYFYGLSNTGKSINEQIRIVFESKNGNVKLFEKVEGTKIVLKNKKDYILKAKITNGKKSFFYLNTGRMEKNNQIFIFPYANNTPYPFYATEIYLEKDGKKIILKITEDMVLEGKTIVV